MGNGMSGYNIVTTLWQRHIYNVTTTTSWQHCCNVTSQCCIHIWLKYRHLSCDYCHNIVTMLYLDIVYIKLSFNSLATSGDPLTTLWCHFVCWVSCVGFWWICLINELTPTPSKGLFERKYRQVCGSLSASFCVDSEITIIGCSSLQDTLGGTRGSQ